MRVSHIFPVRPLLVPANVQLLLTPLSLGTCVTTPKSPKKPQRRRMMFVVGRRDAFSVSVWKCSVTDCCRAELVVNWSVAKRKENFAVWLMSVLWQLDDGNAALVEAFRLTWCVRRLQSVLNLNAAARQIYRPRTRDHTTDALISLHWLRVPERIQYKLQGGCSGVESSTWRRTMLPRSADPRRRFARLTTTPL